MTFSEKPSITATSAVSIAFIVPAGPPLAPVAAVSPKPLNRTFASERFIAFAISCVSREPDAAFDQALELAERDQAAGKRHRADDAPEHAERKLRRTVRFAPEQLHGGNRAGRATAHAVVQRDHLRHVRHRDAPPGDPRD